MLVDEATGKVHGAVARRKVSSRPEKLLTGTFAAASADVARCTWVDRNGLTRKVTCSRLTRSRTAWRGDRRVAPVVLVEQLEAPMIVEEAAGFVDVVDRHLEAGEVLPAERALRA